MLIPRFHVPRDLISGGIQMVHSYIALRLFFPRLDVFRLFQLILMKNNKVPGENHIAKSSDQLSLLILLLLLRSDHFVLLLT